MKKITLGVALLATVLTAKAQDTTCAYFAGDIVYKFDYQTDSIIGKDIQTTKYYDIEVKYGDVLCLDLNDKKNKIRKVIITFFDGETVVDILDSKDNVYYSPQGTTKVSVGKSKNIILIK